MKACYGSHFSGRRASAAVCSSAYICPILDTAMILAVSICVCLLIGTA